MKSLRINKDWPSLHNKGPFAFISYGSCKYVDNPEDYHVRNIDYYDFKFDLDFNKWANVWSTSNIMNISQKEMIFLYEITKNK